MASNEVDFLFEQRKNFIVIGLTGKTGSGCTTVSNILEKSFKEIELDKPKNNNFNNNDERKYRIIYQYSNENWHEFTKIQVGAIITTFILDNNFKEFKSFLKENKYNDDKKINKIEEGFCKYKKKYDLIKLQDDNIDNLEEKIFGLHKDIKEKNIEKSKLLKELHEFYLQDIIKYTKTLRESLNDLEPGLYTKVYQKIGNNIRKKGVAFGQDGREERFENVFTISKRINLIIKILREEAKLDNDDKKVLVVIDAFRNPYEAIYFKERYSAFYLFSVNSKQNDRNNRLEELGLTQKQILEIDNIEGAKTIKNAKDVFYNQNIEKCIEIADVYLYNPTDECKKYKNISKQIIRYISLIMHPGLVTPTNIERCMQIAYNAKVNSGCISRQVGALITDEDYSIKSIGWNDVPHGQVPCNLKNIDDYLGKEDMEAYSTYECCSEEFREYVKEKWQKKSKIDLQGRNTAYCFKDIYNGIKKDKNQVHTRSLHAEENAFLQVSKYGGVGLRSGNLFTTASPCELCAKKAYQIGIKNIYYIDLYPGISESHILNNGDNRPHLLLFSGAIGKAYIQFYTPIIPYKDELNKLVKVNFKNSKEQNFVEQLEELGISGELIKKVRNELSK